MVDRTILLDFFLSFSRFEYALINSGYRLPFRRPRINREEDYDGVKPNWKGFGQSIKNSFNINCSEELLEACTYYLDNPPRRLNLINDELMWETQSPKQDETTAEFLIRMICSVRNNLFHGVKCNVGVHEDAERNQLHLRHALVIMQYCLSLSPSLATVYENAVI